MACWSLLQVELSICKEFLLTLLCTLLRHIVEYFVQFCNLKDVIAWIWVSGMQTHLIHSWYKVCLYFLEFRRMTGDLIEALPQVEVYGAMEKSFKKISQIFRMEISRNFYIGWIFRGANKMYQQGSAVDVVYIVYMDLNKLLANSCMADWSMWEQIRLEPMESWAHWQIWCKIGLAIGERDYRFVFVLLNGCD